MLNEISIFTILNNLFLSKFDDFNFPNEDDYGGDY